MSRRQRHGLCAALLVTTWIVAPLLSAVHFAAEEHRYCAEHDALEEAPDRDDDIAGAPSTEFDSLDSHTDSEALHAACAHATEMLRDGATDATADCVRAAVLPQPLLADTNAIAPPIAALTLAPKTSPPATA